MAGLLARLRTLAGKRSDLDVAEVEDIDSWGFLLFRDGKYHIYVNKHVRDFRKTMILVEELGHYAFRRRQARRGGSEPVSSALTDRILLDKVAEIWAAKFSKRLLYMVRRGLHGTTSRRPRQGAYDPKWRLPVK